MNQETTFRYYQESKSCLFDFQGGRLRWMFRQAKRRFGTAHIHALNIGIGNGWIEQWSADKRWRVHSIDVVPETVERMKLTGVDANLASITDMPFGNNSMDVVFCGEVLEHLTPEECKRGLAEIRRVLHPCGILIGTTPANEQLGLSLTVCPDCASVFHPSGHHQSFTKKAQRELLESNGFEVKKQYVSAFLDFSRQPWYGKLAMLPFYVMGRLGRGFSHVNCGFVSKKEG